jgi:O-antigen/teichoic acid export membrane protein
VVSAVTAATPRPAPEPPDVRDAPEAAAPSVRALAGELLRGSTLLLAASAAGSALNVLYTFAAARLLTPTEYGELIALLSMVSVLGTPAGTVQVVVARFGAIAMAGNTLPAFKRDLLALFRLLAGAAGVLLLAGLAASGGLAGYLHLPGATPVRWAVLLIAAGLLLPVLRGAVQGFCRFGTLAALGTAEIAGKVLLGLALMALGLGTAGAMAAMATGAAAVLLLGAWSLRDFLRLPAGPPRGSSAAGEGLAAMARFAAPALGAAAGLNAMVLVDTFFSRHYLSPDDAGAYAAVAVAVLPLAARLRGRHGPSGGLLLPALGVTTAVSGGALLVFALAPGLVMRTLFGASYEHASGLLAAYGAAALLLSLANVTVNSLLGEGRGLAALPVVAGAALLLALITLFHATPAQLIGDLLAAALAVCAGLLVVVRAARGERSALLAGRARPHGEP